MNHLNQIYILAGDQNYLQYTIFIVFVNSAAVLPLDNNLTDHPEWSTDPYPSISPDICIHAPFG